MPVLIPELPLRKRVAAICMLAVAALALAGCGDGEGDEDPDGPEPEVEFVAPKGDELRSTVTAVVEVEGFEIDPDALGEAPVEGVGHLRFTMDRGQFDFPEHSGANGALARKLGVDGQYSPATEPTITYRGLPPGEHRLTVALVGNDHEPVGASDSITFTVE
jgi:hypothetical protein